MSVEIPTMRRVQTWKELEGKALEAVEETYAGVQGERTVLLPPSPLNHPAFVQKKKPHQKTL